MPVELWQFQGEDISELEEVKSVLLGHEMGAGKTVESIERDKRIRARPETLPKARTLVVCKKSGILNTWVPWFQKHAPELKVVALDPKNRTSFVKALQDNTNQVFICHWESLRLKDMQAINKHMWTHIIADEVHKAKNRKAQQTQALWRIPTVWKTALSGTAADNKPHDLWAILHWLWPKQYSSYWRFYNRHIDFEVVYPQGYHKIRGTKNVDVLLSEMKPFYRRHLKKEKCCDHHPNGVMPWLPDKYYREPVYVDLLPEQRRAYDEMKKNLVAWVGEQEASQKPVVAPVLISQLQRLQQFAVSMIDVVEDPKSESGVRYEMIEPSSKLDAVMDILEDTDHPVVVFSQFKAPVYMLKARCDEAEIGCVTFTGNTTDADRKTAIDAFQNGQVQVFTGTIAAGGEGIDLYRGSTVIFIDRAWSPAMNKQAEDRLWRGGQQNAVEVIDIIARNTVDFGRLTMIEQKWSWIKQILGDGTYQSYLMNRLDSGQSVAV